MGCLPASSIQELKVISNYSCKKIHIWVFTPYLSHARQLHAEEDIQQRILYYTQLQNEVV